MAKGYATCMQTESYVGGAIQYGHENEMYNVGLNLKEVECL